MPHEKAEDGRVSASGERTQQAASSSPALYVPEPGVQTVESKSSDQGAETAVQWVVPKIGPIHPDLSDGPQTSLNQN